MKAITTKTLTQTETEKIQQDLKFISLLTQAASELGVRVIIHGGYSVDAALGTITKPHKDIDIQVYGNSDNAKAVLQNLLNLIAKDQFDLKGTKWKNKGRSTYYHNFLAIKGRFCADFYYIQVVGNPVSKYKIIIKDDGSRNEIQKYRTHQVSINGVFFEATLPEDELKDKKSKKPRVDIKHDIANLERLIKDARFK